MTTQRACYIHTCGQISRFLNHFSVYFTESPLPSRVFLREGPVHGSYPGVVIFESRLRILWKQKYLCVPGSSVFVCLKQPVTLWARFGLWCGPIMTGQCQKWSNQLNPEIHVVVVLASVDHSRNTMSTTSATMRTPTLQPVPESLSTDHGTGSNSNNSTNSNSTNKSKSKVGSKKPRFAHESWSPETRNIGCSAEKSVSDSIRGCSSMYSILVCSW